MCKEYINIQTGEKLNFEKVSHLKDNAMLKARPELWCEWDFQKNNEINNDIWKMTKGSTKLVWWNCPKCGSSYDMIADKRTKDRGCPYCAGKRVNHTNSLGNVKPHIAKLWHPTLNGDLTPYDITSNNSKVYWWYCSKCGNSYETSVSYKRTTSCPYCAGQKINHTNSLASLNPQLAKEWHPTNNGVITPHNVSSNSNKKYWWFGECGHEWESVIGSRNKGCNCPYCKNQKIDNSNCINATNPELVKLLVNKHDAHLYSIGSTVKVDWKCPDCGEIIKNKAIYNIKKSGLSCPVCSDKISYPEKVMYSTLLHLNLDFDYQKTFEWSNRCIYDFIIKHPSGELIIAETHGEQHYVYTGRGRSLEEEQANDKYKYEMAIQNGIKPENYIVIDCRESNINWIKSSLSKTIISQFSGYEKIKWEEIHEKSLNSLVKYSCDLWTSGIRDTSEIAEIVKLKRRTIVKYLKIGFSLNWCDYDSITESKLARVKAKNKISRKIVQLSKSYELIAKWASISDAMKYLNKNSSSNIVKSCNNSNRFAYGYKWMYLEDYEEMLENQNKIS